MCVCVEQQGFEGVEEGEALGAFFLGTRLWGGVRGGRGREFIRNNFDNGGGRMEKGDWSWGRGPQKQKWGGIGRGREGLFKAKAWWQTRVK